MAKSSSISLIQALNESRAIRLYGKPLSGFDPIDGLAFGDSSPKQLSFALIRAYSAYGTCQAFPYPVLIAVPGDGAPAQDDCGKPGESYWTIFGNENILVLEPSIGEADTTFEELLTKGISGGIRLENPRIEHGKACVDIHIWAKIKVLGKEIKFDERFPICIPLQGCHTVWDIGWARLGICFRAPKSLCGKLCVGKWGLEKCWDHCEELTLVE